MKQYTLSNGLTLMCKKGNSALTSICISLDAGAAVETGKLGLAHATEHMVYKGTMIRSEKQINEALSRVFGFQNAMTNFPYVIYYGSLLEDDFREGVELFGDILMNPTFDEAGFHEEMSVIKEELQEWDEEVGQFCEDELFKNAFSSRRIKDPIIGTVESLEAITLEDIRGFYESFYYPKNTSIGIVTSMDFEKVRDVVESVFGQWKGNGVIPVSETKETPASEKFIATRGGIQSCKVEIIYPINDLNETQLKALRVFNEFFGEGVNSLLYEKLRTETGFVYDVQTKIAYEKHIQLYKIMFSTSSENVDQALGVISECIEQLDAYWESADMMHLSKSMRLKRLFREEQSIIIAKELATYQTMFGDGQRYENEAVGLELLEKERTLSIAKQVLINPAIQIVEPIK